MAQYSWQARGVKTKNARKTIMGKGKSRINYEDSQKPYYVGRSERANDCGDVAKQKSCDIETSQRTLKERTAMSSSPLTGMSLHPDR
jgi:hypothetical protein